MRLSVVTSILAFLATTTSEQYTVLELAPISPISPISPLPPTPTSTSTTSTSKIASIATITVAPLPYYPLPNGTLTNSTLPTNSTSCAQTLCIDYINTCGIMYGGCFPHCPGMTTPSFTNPGCPSNKFYPGKTPETSLTTATCGYKCDNFVDGCGQTYGRGCRTSCEGRETPGWTTPVCGVEATGVEGDGGVRGVRTGLVQTESGEVVETSFWGSETRTSFTATATGAAYSQILEDEV